MFPDIEHEVRIEWHEDPFRYPYLRETWTLSRSRTRAILPASFGKSKRVIGYAVLAKNTEPNSCAPWGAAYWHRRVWWLYLDDAGMPEDRRVYGPATESYPSEAASPFAIKAGRPTVLINHRPIPSELEKEDPRLYRLLAWLIRQGGKADLREVLRHQVSGIATSQEALALLGRLAELSWCWVREEKRGRTGQRVLTAEIIFFKE